MFLDPLRQYSCGYFKNDNDTLEDAQNNKIKHIIKKSHEFNAIVLVDGAQATPHMKIDVIDLDVDFYVTSTHKICGPTRILFVRRPSMLHARNKHMVSPNNCG